MPCRTPTALELSAAERAELGAWARRRKTAQGLALRARVVLRAAEGLSNTATADALGIAKHTAGNWRERFAAAGRRGRGAGGPHLAAPAAAAGQAESRTHDDVRGGTTSLFAALDAAAGRVIGRCFPRERAAAFRRFLDEIEAHVPPDLDAHRVLDNSATHKTKRIRDWLAKRPRDHVHFTPTCEPSAQPRPQTLRCKLPDQETRRG